MMLKNETDVIRLIQSDEYMMDILQAVRKIDLPDWWICAGFVRSKIWDTLHGFHQRTELPDVDVIYFDNANIGEDNEKAIECVLAGMMPNAPWSVKNQARMHVLNQLPPYKSSEDAISKFPETATALGVKLDMTKHLILSSPWGLNDVLTLQVKPTPLFIERKELADIYLERIKQKDWKAVWPKIIIDQLIEND